MGTGPKFDAAVKSIENVAERSFTDRPLSVSTSPPLKGPHVPALDRRTLALVQFDLALSRQPIPVQTYTNFCLPHAALAFDLLCLRVLARSVIVPALLGPVAAIVDITPAAAVVLAGIQE